MLSVMTLSLNADSPVFVMTTACRWPRRIFWTMSDSVPATELWNTWTRTRPFETLCQSTASWFRASPHGEFSGAALPIRNVCAESPATPAKTRNETRRIVRTLTRNSLAVGQSL